MMLFFHIINAIKTFLALYEILIENKLIIKKGLSSSSSIWVQFTKLESYFSPRQVVIST